MRCCSFVDGSGYLLLLGEGLGISGRREARERDGCSVRGRPIQIYGLRARCRIWPPYRPTRLSLELAEVIADLPHMGSQPNLVSPRAAFLVTPFLAANPRVPILPKRLCDDRFDYNGSANDKYAAH